VSTVKETCSCGATFEYSAANGAEVTIAASHFRAKHVCCRTEHTEQAAKATGEAPQADGERGA
jgi:hypothetical protein